MSRRCLVIHPGALGDALLAVPALAHLRMLSFRTTLAVTSRLVPLFAGSGLVAEARDVESLALHRLFVEAPDPRALAPVAGWDALVSWFGAEDAAYRASLRRLRCPVVVARALPPPGAGRHVSRHLIETLAPLGPLPSKGPEARLDVPSEERAAVTAWLAARGIPPGEAVVLQPGAGSAAKAWPGFAALAGRLREAAVPVVLMTGPADRALGETLVAAAALDDRVLARNWPLPRVAALLALARAAVGNDSGPSHLAAAVGCPTVAIFGPTDPAVWAPLGPRVRVVVGPSGARPWAGLEVEAVLAALGELVAARPGPPVLPAGQPAWR